MGRSLDPEHHRLRDLLTRSAQPHEWLEEGSPAARALLAEHGLADPPLPVVVDGPDVHVGASFEDLAERWGNIYPPRRGRYELAVVGAGPAGLAAAV